MPYCFTHFEITQSGFGGEYSSDIRDIGSIRPTSAAQDRAETTEPTSTFYNEHQFRSYEYERVPQRVVKLHHKSLSIQSRGSRQQWQLASMTRLGYSKPHNGGVLFDVQRKENPRPSSSPSPIDETIFDNIPTEPSPSTLPIPYSVFTKEQKRYITYLLGFLTLASSLTATIYFPLIPLLAEEYQTSTQAINLTITLYVVFQGVTPAFWGPLSDTFGRRPVLMITFGLYTAASLGLAFSRGSYPALILLRALQSTGGSAVVSLSYAVVADLVTSAERGSMLGPLLASGNIGPCIGPIIGGAVVTASQSTWCFWTLVIFGYVPSCRVPNVTAHVQVVSQLLLLTGELSRGISTLLITWTLPETRRTIVGDGSVRARGIWRTWWSSMVDWRRGMMPKHDVQSGNAQTLPCAEANESGVITDGQLTESKIPDGTNKLDEIPNGKGKLVVPNPSVPLRLIFYWDTFIALSLSASPYAVWYLIQTSIPIIYGYDHGGYGFEDVYVGLCYLPGAFGVISGGLIAGRMMDKNYKHVATKIQWREDCDQADFPIEQARSRFSITILTFSMLVLVGFGWVIQFAVHPAVPLIFQFYLGAKCTILLQVYSALLVDIFPEKPGTIAASNNITRCGLSAAVVAALDPLVGAMGRGWFFTMVALLDGCLCIVGVIILRCFGQGWREKRRKIK